MHFFFTSRRRHTRCLSDWSSDVCSSDLLVNGGAEAVENAVKIARAYTRRPAVICFEDAFHGRTLLTLSLTSKIGRASCRERVKNSDGGESLQKKHSY